MSKKEWQYTKNARMEYGYAASMIAERLEAIHEDLHELVLIGDAMGSQQAFGPGGAPLVPPGQPGSDERKADDALGQIKNVVGGLMGDVICERSVDGVRCILLEGHGGGHVFPSEERCPAIDEIDGKRRRCRLLASHKGACKFEVAS